MIAIIVGFVIGFGLPVQTSINSRLRGSLGSPYLASLVSFLVGTLFLGVITVISGTSLGVSSTFIGQQPWWIWLGGLLGLVYLTGNILLFPKLGSVQTVIMPVVGQILAGLLIDNFGLFYSPTSSLTIVRVLGALLVLLGVISAVSINDWVESRSNKLEKSVAKKKKTQGLMFWRLAGVITGMLNATQTAINGHLGHVLGSPVKGAFISFVVGTVGLIIIVLILRPTVSALHTQEQSNPIWMWFGGFIGALYVLGNVYLVPIVGTGLAVVIVLVGLMVGSLLIDQFGWFGAKKSPVTRLQLLSLLVMVIGVVLIRVV
ncbi:orotate transport protein [Secundilactobacillus oryzae JCM 18671]|uniref:Orotate transport protein n=1 Tax=Secundilactobacillus oryzae JCM 18671 TaxID=1291743 RepID=A0A081BJR5_9LACO|nr:DMT family transporter [Secundilactobacillus oryzae]GAK48283.1 orotate transport protein [Secundilactobacillus oryzae JCM 18671]